MVGFAVCAAVASADEKKPDASAKKPAIETTHETIKEIVVKPEKGNGLQTICPGPDGQILALISRPRYGPPPKADVKAEVRSFDADGQPLAKWAIPFVAQSINSGPGGAVFVAGDGRIARLGKDGSIAAEVALPHLEKILADTESLRKQAEEQLKEQIKSFEDMIKSMTEQKQALEKKSKDDPDSLTKAEKNQLRALEMNLKSYEQAAKGYKNQTVDDVVKELTSRLRIINAVAADEKYVYIACGELKGYGYSVWRMDHDFQNPKQIAKGFSGCCGQMDIQCSNGEVLVAENSRHRVVRLDPDGKKLGTFGKAGRDGQAECFGGCCNPMNLRVNEQGVYTAESEGPVKLFTPKGDFVAAVGTVKISGGCKNVAIAVSADGSRVYFCDQPGGKILVLARKNGAGRSTE
jgi:hypothetical protein